MNKEAKVILDSLPRHQLCEDLYKRINNAYIYIDSSNRLCIYVDDTWLGFENYDNILGDLAPFCG